MAKSSKWGNIVFYKTKEGELRWFDPDKAKTPEGKAKIKAIRSGKKISNNSNSKGKITEMDEDSVTKASLNLKAKKEFTTSKKKSDAYINNYMAHQRAKKASLKARELDDNADIGAIEEYKKASKLENKARQTENEYQRSIGNTKRDELNIERAKKKANERLGYKARTVKRDELNIERARKTAQERSKLKQTVETKQPRTTEMTPERKAKALDALKKKKDKAQNKFLNTDFKKQRSKENKANVKEMNKVVDKKIDKKISASEAHKQMNKLTNKDRQSENNYDRNLAKVNQLNGTDNIAKRDELNIKRAKSKIKKDKQKEGWMYGKTAHDLEKDKVTAQKELKEMQDYNQTHRPFYNHELVETDNFIKSIDKTLNKRKGVSAVEAVDSNGLKWEETPYGYKQAKYKGHAIEDGAYRVGKENKISVNIGGDDVFFDSVKEAQAEIDKMTKPRKKRSAKSALKK